MAAQETTTVGQAAPMGEWQMNLTPEEAATWMEQLKISQQPECNKDHEEKFVREVSVGAIPYYEHLANEAKHLLAMVRKCKTKEDCDEALERISKLVYNHQPNANAAVVDALRELKGVLPSSSPAAAVSQHDEATAEQAGSIVNNEEIDKEMNENEKKVKKFDTELAREIARARLAETRAERRVADFKIMALQVDLKTKSVDANLDQMAKLSQAENSMATIEARNRSLREKNLDRKARIIYKDDAAIPENPASFVSDLYEKSSLFNGNALFSKDHLEDQWKNKLDDRTKKAIQGVHDVYNSFIENSKFLDKMTTSDSGDSRTDQEETSATESGPPKKRQRRNKDINGDEPEAAASATLPVPDIDKYKEHVNDSVLALEKLFRNNLDEVGGETNALTGSDHGNQQLEIEEEETFFPGPRGNEVAGAQPFFACLLNAIGSIAERYYVNSASGADGCGSSGLETINIAEAESTAQSPGREGGSSGDAIDHTTDTGNSISNKSSAEPTLETPRRENFRTGDAENTTKDCSSPPQNQLGQESAVLGESGKYRFGDFVVQKSGKYIWVFRADTLPIVFEIKAFYRPDKSWTELIINAVQQVFNHTSRYLRVGLNFAGAGVNSYATGVVGSLAYIQVYRLELHDVGTEDVHVRCVKSELLPLMSKDNFTEWIKANHREGEDSKVSDAEKTLYPDAGNENDCPYGLLLMLQLMMARKSELFGQTHSSIDNSLTLLASGTFGNVFLKNDGTVVKLTRHGRISYLRSEELAYKAVGHCDADQGVGGLRRCHNLAVAKYSSESVLIGNVERKMASLVVTPVGKPLTRLGSLAREQNVLVDVVFDVSRGLQHMHRCGVGHNDLSMPNVLVVQDQGPKKYRAVLFDLSLASPFAHQIPFFVGNPIYAHRDVHHDSEWYPRPFHDMAGLGLLAAVLANGSIVPWTGLSSPVKPSTKDGLQLFTSRLEKAKEIIGSILPDGENKAIILSWIDLDKDKSILRKKCSCRGICKKCNCITSGLQCLPICACRRHAGSTCANTLQYPQVLPVNMGEITYERSTQLVSSEGRLDGRSGEETPVLDIEESSRAP